MVIKARHEQGRKTSNEVTDDCSDGNTEYRPFIQH